MSKSSALSPARLSLPGNLAGNPTLAALAWVKTLHGRGTLRRDLRRLAETSPHLLADLGLDRDAVLREVSKPLWVA